MKMIKVNDSFEIGKYPVTQKQWFEVMDSKPSYFNYHPKRPVESVSWDEIHDFIANFNTLEQTKGRLSGYRLPTEVEWRLAAGELPSLNSLDYGWFRENSKERTHKVGLKLPTSLGFCDLYGNVGEWIQDDNSCGPCLIGGSWSYSTVNARAAFRNDDTPAFRYYDVGFRVARSLL